MNATAGRSNSALAERGGDLLPFDSWCQELAAEERRNGWLDACQQAGRFLAPAGELIDAVAELLGSLGGEPLLEVCSGTGELAAALRNRGVPIEATDVDPPKASRVRRMSAEEALVGYRPRVVLGAFVPVDSGVDEAVLRFPTVRHYLVLGARVGGLFGSPVLWRHPRWQARPLEPIARQMLTRHDVWIGGSQEPILKHGEAWHFYRDPNASPDAPARGTTP